MLGPFNNYSRWSIYLSIDRLGHHQGGSEGVEYPPQLQVSLVHITGTLKPVVCWDCVSVLVVLNFLVIVPPTRLPVVCPVLSVLILELCTR